MKRANGQNQVRFNMYSEESRRFVESCYAYATPEIAADLHRQHGYRVRFDDNPGYPQIIEIIEEVSVPNTLTKSCATSRIATPLKGTRAMSPKTADTVPQRNPLVQTEELIASCPRRGSSACLQTLGFKRWYSLVSPLVFTATYSGHSGKGFQTPPTHALQRFFSISPNKTHYKRAPL